MKGERRKHAFAFGGTTRLLAMNHDGNGCWSSHPHIWQNLSYGAASRFLLASVIHTLLIGRCANQGWLIWLIRLSNPSTTSMLGSFISDMINGSGKEHILHALTTEKFANKPVQTVSTIVFQKYSLNCSSKANQTAPEKSIKLIEK